MTLYFTERTGPAQVSGAQFFALGNLARMGSLQPDFDEYFLGERSEMQAYVPGGIKRLLDVGCGAGAFAAAIKAREGCEAWGIEIEPAAAELAKEKLDRVLVGDASDCLKSLEDEYFDCAVFNDSLEHMVRPDLLLVDLKRVLSPGGYVVASIPNIRHFRALAHILFEKDFRYRESGTFDATHLRWFTQKSIQRMFDEAGYRIQVLEGINATQKRLQFGILNLLTLGSLSDSQFVQFAVLAKKDA